MASRAPFRFSAHFAHFARPAFRRPFNRRYQTTDAASAASQSYLARAWNSPVGVKTVHFWAPVMKWVLTLVGASDFARPAGNLSLTQNLALTATGIIWTRWCFVIRPANMLLAGVNFLLAGVGITQVTRILLWQKSQRPGSVEQAVERDAIDVKETAKGVIEDPQKAAKKVEMEVK